MSDGVTHINVYSKGQTVLGRALSNFAHTPFVLDGLRFASVEAWWYYQSLIRLGEIDANIADLCPRHGFNAKKRGQELHARREVLPPTMEDLRRAYLAKLLYNPVLAKQLVASTLPFDHYYEWRHGEPHKTKWRWTGLLWDHIRDELCS